MFTADSFWNQRVDDPGLELDPASDAMVAYFANEVRAETDGLGPHAVPIYHMPEGSPRQPLGMRVGPGGGTVDSPANRDLYHRWQQGVPIPDEFVVTNNKDHAAVIFEEDADGNVLEAWDGWQFEQDPNTDEWSARLGGWKANLNEDLGIFRNVFTDSSRKVVVERPWWGVTAAGFPYYAGVVLVKDLAAGEVNHALNICLKTARKAVHSRPAQRTDGDDAHPNALVEGSKLRIDPSVDLETLGFTADIEMVIAKAAQKFGMVPSDQTLGGAVVRCEVGCQEYFPTQMYTKDNATGKYVGLGDSWWAAVAPHLQVLQMDLTTQRDDTPVFLS